MTVPNPSQLVTAEGLHVLLGGLPVLRDISLTVNSQEAVAVLGPNGSGKTTLIRTVLGLVAFQEGQLELFGTPIQRFRQWNRVGYVPQHASLHVASATVREVVTSGRLAHRRPFIPLTRADRVIVDHCLERVGLADRARWPFSPLSGGQKQRVLIARALATQPQLLVMDEPFAGVDLPSQSQLAELLATLRDDGLGMLIVLHEIGAMAAALDRHIMICDGRITTQRQLDEHL